METFKKNQGKNLEEEDEEDGKKEIKLDEKNNEINLIENIQVDENFKNNAIIIKEKNITGNAIDLGIL